MTDRQIHYKVMIIKEDDVIGRIDKSADQSRVQNNVCREFS